MTQRVPGKLCQRIAAGATAALIALIRVYQSVLRVFLVGSCRFHPSCSEYAIGALRSHGPWRGAMLAARRLSRCQPFGGCGFDPVPPAITPRVSSE